MTPLRYCFVLPRFGEGVIGGAEAFMGALARRLHEGGATVEVFTTCAKDNRSWDNFFPAGESLQFGVPTTRFPVNPRDLERWIPHQIAISEGQQLALDSQFEWLENGVNSAPLYEAILKRRNDFDLYLFGPYLFGTTIQGSLLVPDKAVLIPCLHDESYAYLEIVASMFRQVRGCVFNAQPEQALAERLYGQLPGGQLRGGVVGVGFDPPEGGVDDNRIFPALSGVPYVLYVGRKETGKNVQLIIDWFLKAREQHAVLSAVKLVIAGPGSFSDLERPQAVGHPAILDIAELSESEKRALMKNALALVQLSTNESFSIVLFEAWQQGTPVIVHSECAVTRAFVEASNGGLYAGSALEFGEILRLLCTENELAAVLGKNGERFTAEQFTWQAVLDRFLEVTRSLCATQPC